MPNNPDQMPISLAQVGFSFDSLTVSLAGVRADGRVDLMTTPRVVILEPESEENIYDEFHRRYKRIIEQDKQVLGKEGSNLLCLLRGDIYQPESLQELPPLAFLVLENVLLDPHYKGTKDLKHLCQLLSEVMVNGGVILTLESKLTDFFEEEKKLIKDFIAIMLSSGNFELVLNLLDFEQSEDDIEIRNSWLVRKELLDRLELLGVVDQALKEGLGNLRAEIYSCCLVFQRVLNE